MVCSFFLDSYSRNLRIRCYTKKSLKEYKDRLPANVVSDIQSKVDAVKKALESGDLSQIRSAKDELNEHMQKIGESMQNAGPAPEQPQGASQEKPDIEEADVEILDKDGK